MAETFESYKAAVAKELTRRGVDAAGVPHKEWRKLYVGHVSVEAAAQDLQAYINNRLPPAERRKTR